MPRFFKTWKVNKGQAPGSFVFIGEKKIEKPRLRIIDFNENNIEEFELSSIDEVEKFKNKKSVTWLNIDGLHDIQLIKRIEQLFGIHALHLEDILNTDQRPVLIEGKGYGIFILKMLKNADGNKLLSEQFSLILKDNFIITFQERVGDVFEPVRDRLRHKLGKIRNKDGDYLAYSLLDTIVDNYIYIIENIGEKVEDLEEKIFKNPDNKVSKEIFNYKMELNYFRKCVRPVREMINQLFKEESDLFDEDNYKYLNDLNHLVLQAIEAIETYNVIITDQLSMYNTLVSNKMNEIMKVLTVFAALFIPLTFFAGIYGMNFEFIPELKLKYGYLYFWILIVIAATSMIVYFKRKKWLK